MLAGHRPRCQDAAAWLARAPRPRAQLNYIGHHRLPARQPQSRPRASSISTSRRAVEKLVNLEGPAREVIRSHGRGPLLLPRRQGRPRRAAHVPQRVPVAVAAAAEDAADFYDLRKAETGRVAGRDAQAWVFKPKDGMRFGHKFWADARRDSCSRRASLNERNEMVEQFAFTEITIGAKIDREMVKPTGRRRRPIGRSRQMAAGRVGRTDTGWVATRLPPGFARSPKAIARCAASAQPVAHIVYSDGLVAVSVFVEPTRRAAAATPAPCSRAASTSTRASWTTIWSPCWARRPAPRFARSPIGGASLASQPARRASNRSSSSRKEANPRSCARNPLLAFARGRSSLLAVVRGRRGAARRRRSVRRCCPTSPSSTKSRRRRSSASTSRRRSSASRDARAVRGRPVLRVLPPLRPDSAPARRAGARLRAAVGGLRASSFRATATSSPMRTSSTAPTR